MFARGNRRSGPARLPAMLCRRLRLAALLFVACGMAVGCGGAATPSAVHVSITAPVDGATVVVPGIEVLGTIEPKNGVVTVSGKRAQVENGTFRRPMLLTTRLTRIKIVARARGYVDSTMEVSVSYQPRPRPASGGVAGSPGSSSGPNSSDSDHRPSSGMDNGGPPSGLEAGFVGGCTNSGGSVGGCTCVWRELNQRGFNTQPQFEALAEQWRRSFLSKGVIAFPPALKSAVLACASDFGPGFSVAPA